MVITVSNAGRSISNTQKIGGFLDLLDIETRLTGSLPIQRWDTVSINRTDAGCLQLVRVFPG